jgi:hypothetical protein
VGWHKGADHEGGSQRFGDDNESQPVTSRNQFKQGEFNESGAALPVFDFDGGPDFDGGSDFGGGSDFDGGSDFPWLPPRPHMFAISDSQLFLDQAMEQLAGLMQFNGFGQRPEEVWSSAPPTLFLGANGEDSWFSAIHSILLQAREAWDEMVDSWHASPQHAEASEPPPPSPTCPHVSRVLGASSHQPSRHLGCAHQR